jgi:hypothetical protein
VDLPPSTAAALRSWSSPGDVPARSTSRLTDRVRAAAQRRRLTATPLLRAEARCTGRCSPRRHRPATSTPD